MEWKFTLHIDDFDDNASPWPDLDSTLQPAFWAIGPLPGDDSGTWLVGLRFVQRDGNPTLIGMKILPDHGVGSMLGYDKRPTGVDIDPKIELTATALRAVTLGTMQRQVRSALASYKDPAWGDTFSKAYDDGEPPSNWSEHDELIRSTGVNTSDTALRSKAGRPAHTDEHLAEVAYHYDRALRNGQPIRRSIEKEMSKGGERLPIEQWVSKARHREFLTSTTKQGQPGGTITTGATETLKRSGFLNANGERVIDQEGTTE